MTEQQRDDKSHQESSSKENQDKTPRLLKRHHHEGLRSLFGQNYLVFVAGTYLLLVYTLASISQAFASNGHKIISDVISYVCIALIVIPIAGLMWYLRPARQTKPSLEHQDESPGKQSLMDRIFDRFDKTSLAKFIIRHVRPVMRIMLLSSHLVSAYQIEEAIRLFQKHPRFSLATIALFMFMTISNMVSFRDIELMIDLRDRINFVHDRLDDVIDDQEALYRILSEKAEDEKKAARATGPGNNT